MATRIFGITGWKNSGKTTLTEGLVAELSRRGWRISTIKHAHHAFDIDRQGTDSFRHRAAGALEVAIVSANRWALMHELRDDDEPALETILERLAPCDLVLIEGYKNEAHPKIECRRREARDTTPMIGTVTSIVAIAADHRIEGAGVPAFDLDDTTKIADFIARHTGLV